MFKLVDQMSVSIYATSTQPIDIAVVFFIESNNNILLTGQLVWSTKSFKLTNQINQSTNLVDLNF